MWLNRWIDSMTTWKRLRRWKDLVDELAEKVQIWSETIVEKKNKWDSINEYDAKRMKERRKSDEKIERDKKVKKDETNSMIVIRKWRVRWMINTSRLRFSFDVNMTDMRALMSKKIALIIIDAINCNRIFLETFMRWWKLEFFMIVREQAIYATSNVYVKEA